VCEVLVGGAVPIYLSSDILCGYVNNLLKEEIGRECVVSIYFVDKNLMKDINASTRGKDYATNVLSFSFNDDLGEKVYLGEILICEDEVLKDAELNGVTKKEEMLFVLTHGLLHLLGYDHKDDTEEAEMNAKESYYLDKYLKIRYYNGR
tara:strand:+ start:7206 stop:7652 length:447 start_codon:yes stop_codon:yes gene_type:complete